MTSKSARARKPAPAWLLPLHALASFCMFGTMAFMQLVHYQLFRFVEPHQFLQFHNNHIMRITPFVGIFMTIELLTALGLFLKEANKLWIANFILVLATWIMTGFWQGPMHIHLGRAYDPVLLELLIKTNYVRLAVWTLHAILVFIGMVQIQKKQLRKISI